DDYAVLHTDVYLGLVRLGEKPVLEDHRSAVGDEAVPLHLPEPETSSPRPPLRRLFREHLDLPPRPRVNLIGNHVVELLVVDDPDEDVGFELLPCLTVVHDLSPSRLESPFVDRLLQLFYLLSLEGRPVSCCPSLGALLRR